MTTVMTAVVSPVVVSTIVVMTAVVRIGSNESVAVMQAFAEVVAAGACEHQEYKAEDHGNEVATIRSLRLSLAVVVVRGILTEDGRDQGYQGGKSQSLLVHIFNL